MTIYIITKGCYSGYGIEDVLDLPRPLVAGDRAEFEEWCQLPTTRAAWEADGAYRVGYDDDEYRREWEDADYASRAWFLKKWLIEARGAAQVTHQLLHGDEIQ